MRALRIVIVVITVIGMLVIWPLHPVKEVSEVRSGDGGHMATQPLKVNMCATQHFKADDNNIIALDYVLSYDKGQPRTGEILFEFMDDAGTMLYTETIPYEAIANYQYQRVVLNLMLKKGRMYQYRLTNLSVTENLPSVIYTVDQKSYGLKKGLFEVNGQSIEGEALTRISSNRPLSMENTMAMWGGIGIAGFFLCALLKRAEKRKGQKK